MKTPTFRKWAVISGMVGGLLQAGSACGQTPSPEAPPGSEPAGSGFRLNGFGTLGATHASAPSGWGFRRNISQPPNDGGTRGDLDSRLGLQLNYNLDSQIDFVGQVVFKRRVETSLPSDSLEWAFASYKPTPDWTIRAGRMSSDTFLLSDYRNVGFAYPWARPDVNFYGAVALYSLDGIDVTRSWHGDGVHWKAKLFYGEAAGYAAAITGQPPAKLLMRDLAGLALSREADRLTLRATVLHLRIQQQQTAKLQPLLATLQVLRHLPSPEVASQAAEMSDGLGLDPSELTYFELGASYEGEAWLMSAELMSIEGSLAPKHASSGYASLGRRFGPLTVYGVLSASRSSGVTAVPAWGSRLLPLVGPQYAGQFQQLGIGLAAGINAQQRNQRSVSLGMRWDMNDRMALKLQWDHFRISANGAALWSNATPEAASANVGTVLLDFIF